MLTLGKMLSRFISQNFDQKAICSIDEKSEMTYYCLNSIIMSLVEKLSALGLRTNDKVYVLGGNTLEGYYSVVSGIINESIVSVISDKYSQETTNHIIDEAKPDVLIVPNSKLDNYIDISSISRDYGCRESLVICGLHFEFLFRQKRVADNFIDQLLASSLGKTNNLKELPDLLTSSHLLDLIDSFSDTPRCIFYTSSSTSKFPKGIVASDRNIVFSIYAISERLDYRSSDTIGLFLPLSFDVGFYQIFLAIVAGSKLFLARSSEVSPFFASQIQQSKITVLPAVPFLLELLNKSQSRIKRSNPSLRMVTSTGERLGNHLTKSLVQAFPDIELHTMYGLTECKRISISSWKLLDEAEKHSVGKPMIHVDCWISDPDSQGAGELVVQGPNVCLGYYRRESTAFEKNHGQERILYTGDICRMDQNGFIYFVGRKDFLIKHNGYRINPEHIEDVLEKEFVRISFCIVKDNKNRLTLFHDSNSLLDSDLRNPSLYREIDFPIRPERIVRISAIPRNINGKKDRGRLSKC